MKKIFVLLAVIFVSTAATFAQTVKLGHINGQKLVEHMPEYKAAYEELEAYKNQFTEALKIMDQEYNQMVAEFEKNKDTWPKAILETKYRDIQNKSEGIVQFQESANKDISEKELQKIEPILKKAKDAIEKVAKANGYTYIFDVSTAVLLYLGGEDITPLVCKELGITDYSKEVTEVKPAPQTPPGPTPVLPKN